MKRNKDVESREHLDPITRDAVAAAMAATDSPHDRTTWRSRTVVSILSVFLFIGTLSGVIGAVNYVRLNASNAELRHEQACLVGLLANVQADSKARTLISADDRRVLDDLVSRIAQAESPKDVRQAFDTYKKTRAKNDKSRDSILFSLPDPSDACKVTRARAAQSEGKVGGTVTTAKRTSTAPVKKASNTSPTTSSATSSNAGGTSAAFSSPDHSEGSRRSTATPTALPPTHSSSAPTARPTPGPQSPSRPVTLPLPNPVPPVTSVVCKLTHICLP